MSRLPIDPRAFAAGGSSDAVPLLTATAGAAGVDALDALSPSAGDYGIIGLGTANQVLLRKGANTWFRPFPFFGGAEYAEGAASKLVEETPQSLGWSTTIPAGATIDYDVTVAGKIFFEAGTAASVEANDDVTTRTASVLGAAIILRAITFDAGIVDNDDFGSFLANPKLGGTATLLGLQVDTSKNLNNYIVAGTAGDEDTGMQFTAESDVEVYALTDGSLICFQDWAALPSADLSVTYDQISDFGLFARIECKDATSTQATAQLDSQHVIELV